MQGVQNINPYGQLAVNPEGVKPTYRGAVNAYGPYATAQDIMNLSNPSGSGKALRVNRVAASGRATAAAQVDFTLIKRSAPNTSGTPTTITNVPMDSKNPTAVGVLVTYGAAPTPGTLVGTIGSNQVNLSAAGSGGAAVPNDWEFGPCRGGQCLVLHPGECLSVNLTGAAVPAGCALDIEWEWTEEVPAYGVTA